MKSQGLRGTLRVLIGACLMAGGSALATMQAQAIAADEQPVVTQHSIQIGGKAFPYTARAGFLALRDAENKVRGRIFYVSYTVAQPAGAPERPLMFVWNGGPGSNAGLLELGALGPRRLVHKDEPGYAPKKLVDNQETWLQVADLVFMDPIHTGYSYAETPEDEKEFLSDRGDAEAAAEFVRLYRTHFERESSPVYLMGESYGTFRAAGVAEILGKRKMPLDGVLMLSNAYGFSTPADLSAAFLLPNYTAAAFAHQRLAAELQKDLVTTVDAAEKFAESEYVDALIQGDRISEEQKAATAKKLEEFTGVAADVWAKGHLRVPVDQFAVLVLGGDRLHYVGHYDTRDIGTMSRPNAPYDVDADPSLDNGLDAAIVPYLRDDLGWKSDAMYAGPFGGRWPTPTTFRGDWTSQLWDRSERAVDRAQSLAAALAHYPQLRVLVANGYYDFSTPFAVSEYAISHLELGPEAKKRIRIVRYAGGHAAYMDAKVRAQMLEDARALVMRTK